MQQQISDLQIKLPETGGASTAGYSRTSKLIVQLEMAVN
jgi:hypothetical protein